MAGATVLITAHGNSLRALLKHLEGVSDDDIADVNIPTGAPRQYRFDERLRVTVGRLPRRRRRGRRRSRSRSPSSRHRLNPSPDGPHSARSDGLLGRGAARCRPSEPPGVVPAPCSRPESSRRVRARIAADRPESSRRPARARAARRHESSRGSRRPVVDDRPESSHGQSPGVDDRPESSHGTSARRPTVRRLDSSTARRLQPRHSRDQA